MRNNNANEFETIMNAVNELATEVASIREDVNNLKGKAKSTTKGTVKRTTSKGTTKKATKKSAPATKAEAIDNWCEKKGYTKVDREAYGEAIREIREEMMAENKKMVKTVKGKKVYDENYYVGKKWTREFNRRMKERGFKS